MKIWSLQQEQSKMDGRLFIKADARVIHSHEYTYRELIRRNFDQGVSQACHPEIFEK